MRKTKRLRDIWYNLSSNQRHLVRKLYYFPADLLDKISGNSHKYVPPRGYIYTGFTGVDSYLEQGKDHLDLMRQEIGLKPDDKVLDIGSGIGRTAIALTNYLSSVASYEGFDVVSKGVEWCESKITADFPNFRFKYVPLFNDLYNESGENAVDFVFPYKDAQFDKVYSFSVFTHMLIEEINNYFGQINRVLNKDGFCLSTFFLYDAHNEDHIANKEDFAFPVKKEGYRLMDEGTKAGNIAISKTLLDNMLSKNNLQLVKIIDGYWKDKIRDIEKSEYQDIVVFKKVS